MNTRQETLSGSGWLGKVALTALCGLALTSQTRPAFAATPEETRAWMDAARAPRQRVDALLAQMTLEEKLAMVHGTGFAIGLGYAAHVPGNSRLGIPGLYLADGPVGVANGSTGVTAFPAPVNQAATWDPRLTPAGVYTVHVGSSSRDLRAKGRFTLR
jgi:beta-glucosidase